MPRVGLVPIRSASIDRYPADRAAEVSGVRPTSATEEMEMPKMKTKSSAKKRFKVSATGKVLGGQAGKRHGMIKRSNTFLRNARGTTVLSEPDTRIVKKFMPNG